MKVNFLSYFLTLISSYLVFWLFSLWSSYSLVSFTSFTACVIHFGISSWLYLFLNKPGRIMSIVTGSLMIIWPLQILFQSIIDKEYSLIPYYLIPILMITWLIILHLRNFKVAAHPRLLIQIVMSIFPAVLFLVYIIHVLRQSMDEGALNIAF